MKCVVCNEAESGLFMCERCKESFDESRAGADAASAVEWAAKRARGFERRRLATVVSEVVEEQTAPLYERLVKLEYAVTGGRGMK